jgi:hypothetical protein
MTIIRQIELIFLTLLRLALFADLLISKELTQSILAVFIIWTFGYYQLNASLIFLFLLSCYLTEPSSKYRQMRLERFRLDEYSARQDLLETKLNGIKARAKLAAPAQTNLLDKERVEFLNTIVKQAWPFVKTYLTKHLISSLGSVLSENSAGLVKIEELDLGELVFLILKHFVFF